MKLLLASLLLFISSFVLANDIYKLKEDALACIELPVISTIVQTAQEDREKAAEMIDFALSNDSCILLKPNIIARLVDLEGGIFLMNPLGHDTSFWVHSTALIR